MAINLGSMLGIRPVDTQSAGTQATSAQLPAFADYSAGDTISAQVTGVKGDTVTMQTPEGNEFNAQFPESVSVNPGDLVDLAVVSKNSSGVSLKPIAINGQSIQLESSELQVYLMDNGIAPSKMNEGAARLLMNYNIAPTAKNVSQLVQVATALPEIPTSVALTMAQNEIPPTRENANALLQLATQPAALGQDVANLSGMVEQGAEGQIFSQVFPEVVSQSATPEQMQTMDRGGLQQLAGQLGSQIQQQGLENMTPRQVQSAIHQFVQQLPMEPEQRAAVEQVLTQAFTQTAEAVQNAEQQTAAPVQPQTAEQPQAQPVQEGGQPIQTPAGEAQPEASSQMTQTGQTAESAPQQPQPAVQSGQAAPEQPVQTLGQPEAAPQQPAAQQVQAQPQQPALNGTQPPVQQSQTQQTQPPVQEVQVQQEQAPAQNAAAPQTAQGTQQSAQTVQPEAERTEAAPPRPEQAPADEARPQQAEARPVHEQPRTSSAQSLVQESPVRQEANEIMSNLGKMVVKVRDGAVQEDAKTLQNGVKEQQHLTNLTREGVNRLFGSTSAIAQKANEMSNQVRVAGQLDQFYYAQVPFQTQQMQGTADLYVFQRQGQKAERERTHITVLIGLDTPHMGRVESVLRSRDERLSVEFRVGTKRVQNFFEDAISSFKTEMRDIGFPLESVTVSQIGEKVTPVNALRVMEPKQEIRLRGLDIEA